jgi:hypothetical protein
LRPRRHVVLLFPFSAAALFAASSACTTVLGLVEPTLDPCPNGCPDANVTVPDANGDATTGDTTEAPDAVAETSPNDVTTPLADAPPDVIPDVAADRGPSTGIRCGTGPTEIFCTAPEVCCLTLDDAGTASYACLSNASSCPGYPIACATNGDCNGTYVCCFYMSGIKCEPYSTTNSGGSCENVIVCDPNGPSDQCPGGQTCTIAYIENNFTLPYYGCH